MERVNTFFVANDVEEDAKEYCFSHICGGESLHDAA